LLRGVRFADGRVHTQSIVMRSASGAVRTVDAEHDVKKWSKWLGDRDARGARGPVCRAQPRGGPATCTVAGAPAAART
ncbi:hypothetical protein R0J91_22495, partial [Micrococcus sp. SIMBA_131]